MTRCPPPLKFHPAGEILWVQHSHRTPPFALNRRKRKGRRAQGIKYERKVHEHFSKKYGEAYLPSPWFYFMEKASVRPRWCQPDGLIFLPEKGSIVIVEVKYQHTADAWWQIRKLYAPVLRLLFPEDLWTLSACEVVKWYDPATAFPEDVRLAAEPSKLGARDFGVHIWKP